MVIRERIINRQVILAFIPQGSQQSGEVIHHYIFGALLVSNLKCKLLE